MRERGRVEWFDRKLGYGFVSRSGGPDVFVHISKMLPNQLPEDALYLNAGDEIEFEVRDVARRNGGKKPQAFDVSLIKQISTSKSQVREAT